MKRNEWFLETDDKTYEIHLGDHDHRARTGINLAEGKIASVKGYFYQQEHKNTVDVAVSLIVMDGEEYRFRRYDGAPLWSRSGSGRGAGGGGGGGMQQ